MVSSLAPEYVVNLTTSVLDQAFTDRTAPFTPDFINRVCAFVVSTI
jgi:hypothetical protein